MKLEQIVTSKSLSEKLSKYINGESLFYYRGLEFNKGLDGEVELVYRKPSNYIGLISAYTPPELAELMKDLTNGELLFARMNIKQEVLLPDECILLGADPNKLGEILLWLCENNLININPHKYIKPIKGMIDDKTLLINTAQA